MKAALLKSVKNIEIEEVPTPEVREGTVLIRVHACGICGSDLKFYNYGDRVERFPTILGHEIAGEVVEAGASVKNLSVGDRLALGNEIPCKKCYACVRGLENACENVISIGTVSPGGLSEYMLLVEDMVERGPINRMPDNVSFDEAALAEPFGCVVNGMEFARMEEGKDVLIIGTGPIGCMMINLAQIIGASKIVVADKSAKRLDMARAFGADHYILVENGEFLNEALSLSKKGYDVVMSACSDTSAHSQAIRAAAKGGFVNLFGGIAKGLSDTVSFPNNFLHYRQFAIGGSFSQTKEHHKRALDHIASGKVKTDKLITHRFALDSIKKAFGVVQNLEGLKVMVNP